MGDPQVVIGLINPKSPTNVGAVMRAAGCYSASAVLYTGNRYNRASKLHTDTKNVQSKIELIHSEDILSNKPVNMKVVCVELVEGATALPKFEHPEHALYIFGPEDGSIKQQLVNQADSVVYIPTTGCMNLAATVNVILYDRLAKSNAFSDTVQTIRDNRDRNNRLKI